MKNKESLLNISLDLNGLWADDDSVANIIKDEIECCIRKEVVKVVKNDKSLNKAIIDYKAKAIEGILKEIMK
jgi:hypothetical protein